MGCGLSSAKVEPINNILLSENGVTEEAELGLNSFLSSDNAKYLRAYSKLCGKVSLLNIWDLIQNCYSSEATPMDFSSLGLALLSYENEFPMGPELLRCCDIDNHTHAQKRIILNQIKMCCLNLIVNILYIPFLNSPLYLDNCVSISKSSNKSNSNSSETLISSNSFEYLSVIATGGYGVVVQARMKSTGIVYAMKIQPKISLLRQYHRDKSRITSELAASVVFNHPYLSSIAYAFHTSTLAMLVSPMCCCGDLSRSLQMCPDGQMSLDRVTFYTAEIVSALMYLHRRGIMYRDLKPPNVLLSCDGHIKLADFGAISGTVALIYIYIYIYT